MIQELFEQFKTTPWFQLAVFAWVFFSIGFWKVYPSRIFVFAALVPCILSIVYIFVGPQFANAILAFDAAIISLALIDMIWLPRASSFKADRKIDHIASLGMPTQSTLTLINNSKINYFAWVKDDTPEDWDCEPEQRELVLRAKSRYAFEYSQTPLRRGAFSLEKVFLRVRSRIGFWVRYLDLDVPSTVHVYPDMKQLQEYALLARTNRLALLGVRRTRRIGQDNEFERLRDYTPDDNYKHIDWRSTARRNKLTVRDFQSNQSQRIIFMIDCGRMMTNEVNSMSLLDHALNSMLMLSYVAIQGGDSVGLICFSDEVHTYIPPKGGRNQMNRLLHGSFDRFPRLVESRYDEAFMHLASHCLKRSMVVLISNVIDEVNSMAIEQHLTRLVGRHLPLAVLLRDHAMFDAVNQGQRDIYRAGAASTILSWRHQILTNLHRKGVLMVDCFPEHMTAPLINQYLEVKARHLL